jgi:RND family efflux transporter MFP subunit
MNINVNKLGFFLWLPLVINLTGCDKKTEISEIKPLRPVKTMTVNLPDMHLTREFSAVVDASRKADISFKIAGELIALNVQQGEPVSAGQVLAKLNDRDIKIQLQDAQSSFDQAQGDFNRAKNLISSKVISQSDFDKLKAQFQSAQAKLSTAENNLEYTELKASFDGVIAKKYTENFQEINAKSPIFALHDISSISLKINVPESIMINNQRDVLPKLIARFDAIEGETFPLTFKDVATQADEITKTYEVTLTMKSPINHTVLPGMTARVIAEDLAQANNKSAAFYLPAKTVLADNQGHYVYVVTRQSAGVGQVNRQAVKIGDITPLGIEIFSGLAQGDVVLTAGMSKVTDGLAVKY